MINEENLNKMYKGLIEGKELTTKELNSYGFNSRDLTNLINNGVLKRTKRGYYSFLSVNNLFHYGKQLIALKLNKQAIMCFEKCYELDPNHYGACFQLFLKAIKEKDYSQAFVYFERMNNSNNKYYQTDNNFYLYLLSMITEIPEKYKGRVQLIQFDDIRIDTEDKRFVDRDLENKVRLSALNKRFILAHKQLTYMTKNNKKTGVQDIIIRTLLSRVIDVQKELKKNIFDLISEKKYSEIISLLETEQLQHILSMSDEYVLFLAKEISKIEETGVIPVKKVETPHTTSVAIKGKNFEKALYITKWYIEGHNIDPTSNSVFLLLTQITDLIKMINEKSNEQKVDAPIIKEDESMSSLDKTNNTQIESTSSTIEVTLISYLTKHDFDNSFRIIRSYLKSISKSEYEFLIVDLIKISLIEQDETFSKPITVLTYMSVGNFTFDISEYIKNFYETLAHNKFNEARIYLDIISNASKFDQSHMLTESLEQALTTTENFLNRKIDKIVIDKDDTSCNPTLTLETGNQSPEYQSISNNSISPKDEIVELPNLETRARVLPQITNETNIKPTNIDYDDTKFIKEKLNEIREKGIVLLKPMNIERRKRIHSIVKEIPNVVSFSIGSDSNRQIVLKYYSNQAECPDYKELGA